MPKADLGLRLMSLWLTPLADNLWIAARPSENRHSELREESPPFESDLKTGFFAPLRMTKALFGGFRTVRRDDRRLWIATARPGGPRDNKESLCNASR